LEEVEHQITELNTLKRQQALANACTHGGWFHASGGGMHLTCNSYLIAAEMSSQFKDRDEAEWEKKLCLQFQVLAEEKALAAVDKGKSVHKLTPLELTALLDWHQCKNATEVKEGGQIGAVETNLGGRTAACGVSAVDRQGQREAS
jgi:hypothetical protein